MSYFKKTIPFLKILLAALLIGWLLQSGKFSTDSLESLLSFKILSLCFLGFFLNIYFANERWRGLLNGFSPRTSSPELNSPNVKLWFRLKTLQLTLLGLFFNFLIPGGVSGDFVKAYYVAKEFPQSPLLGIASSLIDRVLGLYAMLLLSLTFLLPIFKNHPEKSIFTSLLFFHILMVTLASLGFALLWSPWISNKDTALGNFFQKPFMLPLKKNLNHFLEIFHCYKEQPRLLLNTLLWSWISQFFAIGTLWWITSHLSEKAPTFAEMIPISLLGFIATAIPISPGGIGVGQTAFYFLFQIYGYEGSVGATTMTVFQILQFCWSLGGLPLFFKSNFSISKSLNL